MLRVLVPLQSTPMRRIRNEGRGVKVQRRWVKWRPLSTSTFGDRRPWVLLLRPKRRRSSSAASFGDRAALFRVVTALHHWWNGLEKVTEKLPPRPLLSRLRLSGATNAVEISNKRKRKPPKLITNWLHVHRQNNPATYSACWSCAATVRY